MLTLLMMMSLSLIESTSMEFSQFVRMYNKSYVGSEVELRRNQYERNVKRIAELNRRHGDVATFGVNRFSDLSFEEFKEQKLGYNYIISEDDSSTELEKTTVLEAVSVDWRNVTTPVRDQGTCGACWVISAIQQLESTWMMNGQSLASFSVQEILDCMSTSDACLGGDPALAYTFLESNNVRLAYSYPYTESGSYDDCKNIPEYVSGLSVVGYDKTSMRGDENAMMNYVSANGPLGACVYANDAWQHYDSGVLPASSCDESKVLNHCVQIVSLNVESDWWRVKNSWNVGWGEHGFIRLSTGEDTCGITGEPHTVTINTPVRTACGDTKADDCGTTSTCTQTSNSSTGICTCSSGAMNPPLCTQYASYVRVESVKNALFRVMLSFYVNDSTGRVELDTWVVICLTFVTCTILTAFFFNCICCIRSKLETDRVRKQFRAMDHYYSELDDECLSSPPSASEY